MQRPLEASGPPLLDIPSDAWIFERIEEWARRLPDTAAFIMERPDGDIVYKFSDVLSQTSEAAASLQARGIQRGDRIGILMESSPHWVFILLGAMQTGAITVPLATALPENQLENILRHSGCRLIFADEPNLEKACTVAAGAGIETIAQSGSHPRAATWQSFRVEGRPPVATPLAGDATALLIYTSGTTGEPKGVQLSMFNVIYEIRGIAEPFEMKPGHRLLAVLPLTHILPLIANALGPLCLGAGVVFLPSISPQRIAEAFSRHRITFFVCVPQFFYLLHKRIHAQVQAQPWLARKAFGALQYLAGFVKSVELRRKLFSRIHRTIGADLRFFASGGSRFDPEVAKDLNRLGYTMLNAYGLTETTAALTATPVRENRIGTVGKPIRGMSVRIDSPNGNGIGEVCVKGPLVMQGYYRDAVHTAESIRDGWFYTGDLGTLDSDNYLSITGRLKEVIVLANGKNVYPEELENHYSQSPFIKEICILGRADGTSSPAEEKLHAIVVPDMDEFRRRGRNAIAETIRFEMENLARPLPSYQHVLSLSLRNEPLPRTVTRKLKRFEIEAEIQANLALRQKPAGTATVEDHPRFQSGIGKIVAAAIRSAKPDAGSLDPALNLELDLGFDSLSRVELLTEIEAGADARVSGQDAARIYTLAELLDALESSGAASRGEAQGWNAILSTPFAGEENLYILKARRISRFGVILIARAVRWIGILFFHLRWRGMENIPGDGPFLLCPNHESFLDAPMMYASLPPGIVAKCFGLGYSDYWTGSISRRIAEFFNIVAVDQSVNLVRALQVAAAGLRHHKVLVIFPEGTRSIDGQLTEFKKGAAILSTELGIPIIPVGINGTFEAWPRTGTLKRHPVDVVFGSAIDPRRFAKDPDPQTALINHLQSVVRELTRKATK